MQYTTLYNTKTDSPYGYCHKKHVYLTYHQAHDTKGCLKKHCWHFEEYPEHEAAKQRVRAKEKKKANKHIKELLI